MNENKRKLFYRYDSFNYASSSNIESLYVPNVKLVLTELVLVKETPKGYWIGYEYFGEIFGKQIWVSKYSIKRYAYPTKKEAMTNFVARTKKRIEILKKQIGDCEMSLSESDNVIT